MGRTLHFLLRGLTLLMIHFFLTEMGLASSPCSYKALNEIMKKGLEKGDYVEVRSKRGNVYRGTYEGVSDGIIMLRNRETGKSHHLDINLLEISPEEKRILDDMYVKIHEKDEKKLEKENGDKQRKLEELYSTPKQKLALSILQEQIRKQENSELTHESGQVPDYSFAQHDVTESLVILNDPRLDPVLYQWVQNVQKRFSGQGREVERAKQITAYVTKTFQFNPSSLFHPFRRARYRFLTEQSRVSGDYRAVALGEFIKNRTGVCRHMVVALQLALQKVGIQSTLRLGEMTYFDPKTHEPIYKKSEDHVWVEMRDSEGRDIVLDPSAEVTGPKKFVRYFYPKSGFERDYPPFTMKESRWFMPYILQYNPRMSVDLRVPVPVGKNNLKYILEYLEVEIP